MLQTTEMRKEMRPNKLAQTGAFDPISRVGFDRMFDEFWRRPLSALWGGDYSGLSPVRTTQQPYVDVIEDKNTLLVRAEVPGTSKEDLDINLAGSTLTIKGEKKSDVEPLDHGEYLYSERTFGSFYRNIELPVEVKSDKVEATFKNGILEVRLPKTEEAKQRPTHIRIH